MLKWLLAVVGTWFAMFAAMLAANLAFWIIYAVLASVIPALPASGTTDVQTLLAASLFSQLVELAIFVPWWRHVSRRGIGLDLRPPARPLPAADRRRALARLGAIVLLGIGLQIVISIALTLLLPLFPQVQQEYTSLMEDSGMSGFTPLSVLSVAIAAPVLEETVFRGIAFQFALRALCPGWSPDRPAAGPARIVPAPTAFWVANTVQALAFGIMHLNVVQGVYAFVLGMVLGWVFARTGKLRWSMALHAAVNFSSYFVNELLGAFGLIWPLGELVLPVVCLFAGIVLFARLTAPVRAVGRRGHGIA